MRSRTLSENGRTRKSVSLAGLLFFSLILLSSVHQATASTNGAYKKTIPAFGAASDAPGTAHARDTGLVIPWGLSRSPSGPWWISDNGAGTASIHTSKDASEALAISVPSPNGHTSSSAPTGSVFNRVVTSEPKDFVIKKGTTSGPSTFIFATENGTIVGWNKDVDPKNAVLAVDRSQAAGGQDTNGAVYKGLAYIHDGSDQYIYATNFRSGTVDMFDEKFNLVKSFSDPQIATTCPTPNQCYAPFGIQAIQGNLYVTFALQKADKRSDQAGAGNGFVDVFRSDGTLMKRLINHGNLNSPWGIALAPQNFGQFSGRLLVGNFGDGTIQAYDARTGSFSGTLKNQKGKPIQTDGLRGIGFGNDKQAGKANELFFTASTQSGSSPRGVFGKITQE